MSDTPEWFVPLFKGRDDRDLSDDGVLSLETQYQSDAASTRVVVKGKLVGLSDSATTKELVL